VGKWVVVLVLGALVGPDPAAAQTSAAKKRFGAKEDDKGISYRTIGEYTSVRGLTPVRAEGVGLVVALRGTGSDPPPNRYREAILKEMQTRDVQNPESVLASNATAVVLLRAFLPAGARKGDTVDVEVWVPPGDATTSLKGGRLLEARMYENVLVNNRVITGEEAVRAAGPVLVWEQTGGEAADRTALLKGKVLGGGKLSIDRDFQLILEGDHRSATRAKILADRINQRFYEAEHGQNRGLAQAKTDRIILLRMSPTYRFDVERFLHVVRRVPLSQSPVVRQQWQQELRSMLLDPKTTMDASLRLEAIGKETIEVLKEGLHARSDLVRFSAAQALAYLGDASGVPHLAKLARDSTTYRAYALTALVAADHPVGRMHLTDLMHAKGAEPRYGAFRALWAFDPRDPLVRGQLMGVDEPAEEETPQTNEQRRRTESDAEFVLHLVESKAEPLVHVSRNFRREIVLFGRDQELIGPLSLRAGDNILLHADEAGRRVHLVSFRPGPRSVVQRRDESSLRLAEVIEKTARLGASYADVVGMLRQASQNGNLAGGLAVNALPGALSLDTLAVVGLSENNSGVVRSSGSAPGLFAAAGESTEPTKPALVDPDSEPDAEVARPAKPRTGLRGLFRRSAN
jgi:hypothetical protein